MVRKICAVVLAGSLLCVQPTQAMDVKRAIVGTALWTAVIGGGLWYWWSQSSKTPTSTDNKIVSQGTEKPQEQQKKPEDPKPEQFVFPDFTVNPKTDDIVNEQKQENTVVATLVKELQDALAYGKMTSIEQILDSARESGVLADVLQKVTVKDIKSPDKREAIKLILNWHGQKVGTQF